MKKLIAQGPDRKFFMHEFGQHAPVDRSAAVLQQTTRTQACQHGLARGRRANTRNPGCKKDRLPGQ
jgi:hypothetical protein